MAAKKAVKPATMPNPEVVFDSKKPDELGTFCGQGKNWVGVTLPGSTGYNAVIFLEAKNKSKANEDNAFHEFCHATQIYDLGSTGYMAAVIASYTIQGYKKAWVETDANARMKKKAYKDAFAKWWATVK